MKEKSLEFIPKDLIRTETALSRFPIHRLSKKGEISIDIKLKNKEGELKTKWKVSHNSEYGQPTALAYKIDTLVINRKIDELDTPVPKIIKLGSLSDITRNLGISTSGTNFKKIKYALFQNAGTLITAKFKYKAKDKSEKNIESAFTRYDVTLTGETLSNGDQADAIYIQLHETYREILNSAQTRPLDYDYLKALTPMAQRFYELLSYQIYGAIKNGTTAKMLYSDFCTYAPQTRFFDWEQVRPQMYRLHKPHIESGYIESIRYEKIREDDGTLDWRFIYIPGRKAKGEYDLATNKRLKRIKVVPGQSSLLPEEPTLPLVPEMELTFTTEEEDLVSRMRKFKVSEKKARELVKSQREAVEQEILVFPSRLVGIDIKSPAGYFIKAVEEGWETPQVFFELQEAKKSKKRTEEEIRKNQESEKLEKEKNDAWFKAKDKLLNMPKVERNSLWEEKRKAILNSAEYKDADQAKLKILEFAIDGMIQADIIEDMMKDHN